jgi:hypothetical protein
MAENTGRGAQRAMLAVGLLMAGGVLFALSTVAKGVNNAFGGVSSPSEPEAPVKAAPKPDPVTGVIHVEDGDPLPPATPISKRARPAPPPAPAAAPGAGRSPAEMSHDELVAEVNALRAQVANLEAQQAAARAALAR